MNTKPSASGAGGKKGKVGRGTSRDIPRLWANKDWIVGRRGHAKYGERQKKGLKGGAGAKIYERSIKTRPDTGYPRARCVRQEMVRKKKKGKKKRHTEETG